MGSGTRAFPPWSSGASAHRLPAQAGQGRAPGAAGRAAPPAPALRAPKRGHHEDHDPDRERRLDRRVNGEAILSNARHMNRTRTSHRVPLGRRPLAAGGPVQMHAGRRT